jgi:hypothetical protein
MQADHNLLRASERPSKPCKALRTVTKNRLVTAHTYRRFQALFNFELSEAVFKGLCAYLSYLIPREWEIKDEELGLFICEYPRFRPAQKADPHLSYHQWFRDHVQHPGTYPATLDRAALSVIERENPYTFALVTKSLDVIAKKRGPGSKGPALADIQAPEADIHRQGSSPPTGPSREVHPTPGNCAPPKPPPGSRQLQTLEDPENPEQPWHVEKELRNRLGVRNKQELLVWLTQVSVLGVYEEYCTVALDPRRLEEESLQKSGQPVPPGRKRSSAKFLINTATLALRAPCAKYSHAGPNKANWTTDDHDLRFIVQLLQNGRASGRWWEYRQQEHHDVELCTIAYRLLCWLRHIHHLTSGTSNTSQAQRAIATEWCIQLRDARAALGGSAGVREIL